MGFLAIIIIIAVIVFQGWLFDKLAFFKLDYKCELSTIEACEGDEIQLIETVVNRKFLPVPWLKVSINTSRWLEFAETRSVISQDSRYVTSGFYLNGKQKIVRRWRLKCLKRGIFRIDNVSLLSGDLLGVRTQSVPVPVNLCLKVYPSIIDIDNIFLPTNYLQGETIVRRWIIDDPFIVSGARNYTPSDPMSRINRSASAKEGKLMVKKNDFTSQYSMTVVLNIQSIENEYFETVNKDIIEYGIKVTASIFDIALKQGIPVRFACNGSVQKESTGTILTGESAGREHICSLLEMLARLELKRILDFEDFLKENIGEFNNCDVIMITTYITEEIMSSILEMKISQNRVSMVLLGDESSIKTDLPEDIQIHILPGAGGTYAGKI